MSPITKKEEAQESGFAQVREALQSFEGDVISAEFDKWGGTLIDPDTGKPIPPKEFLEVKCTGVKVLTVSEELSMAIDEWSFRVNCSNYKGSFWVEDFLDSADKAKLLIPDELISKRILWKKATRSWDIKGRSVDYTNYVIDKVIGAAGATPTVVAGATVGAIPEGAPVSPVADPMEVACDLAVGKTETQFRSAISLHPSFVGSSLLGLAKAGAITKSLVEQGKLVIVGEGAKAIYQKA